MVQAAHVDAPPQNIGSTGHLDLALAAIQVSDGSAARPRVALALYAVGVIDRPEGRALAGGDWLQSERGSPVDERADQAGLVAIGEGVDHAVAIGDASQCGADHDVRLD